MFSVTSKVHDMPNDFSSKSNQLKIIEFVRDLCSDTSINEEDLPDIFIKRLVELLFKISETVPSVKLKLHKIIAVLVELGVLCRSKLNADKNFKNIENRISDQGCNKKRKLDIPLDFLKDIEYSDPRLEKVLFLYQIDQKIETLTQDKINIYQEIFKPNDRDVQCIHDSDSDSEKSVRVDSVVTSSNNVSNAFQDETVSKVLEREAVYLTIKTELFSETNDSTARVKVKAVGENVKEEKMEEEESENENMNNDDGNKLSLSSLWVSKEVSTVKCLKTYKGSCIAGCANGDVLFISLKSGTVDEVHHHHEQAVSSLVIWNNRIISSSLDSSLKCYDMTLSKMKGVSINSPIESMTDDGRGVVYVGTSSGHVHRFNVLPLTQIGSSVQVSSNKIICLQTVYVVPQLLLIVCSKGKPLTIRDAESGSLIRSIDINYMDSFDILSGTPNILIGATKHKIFSVVLDNSSVVKTRKLSTGCSALMSHSNHVYVLNSVGDILVYNQDLQCIKTVHSSSEMNKDKILTFTVYDNNNFIVYSKKHHLLKHIVDNAFQLIEK